jgi:hypothetical protein
MSGPISRRDRIETLLQQALKPETLQVTDDSAATPGMADSMRWAVISACASSARGSLAPRVSRGIASCMMHWLR